MTTTPAAGVRRARAHDTPELVRLLETGFARPGAAAERSATGPGDRYQFLLYALDQAWTSRFVVWPSEAPVAMLYTSDSGTIVPAGDRVGGPALAGVADRVSWRVLIGDEAIGRELCANVGGGLFRRAPRVRQQRLMVFDPSRPPVAAPRGLRPARAADVDRLVDFACALHVEDLMGPPLARAGRVSIRAHMHDNIASGSTWVVEARGRPVAKIDVAFRSDVRGAQIAGVYVDRDWRGRGIGGAAVGAVARMLADDGLPAVTLHVRSDNVAALRAYDGAGFVDRCAWVLALR